MKVSIKRYEVRAKWSEGHEVIFSSYDAQECEAFLASHRQRKGISSPCHGYEIAERAFLGELDTEAVGGIIAEMGQSLARERGNALLLRAALMGILDCKSMDDVQTLKHGIMILNGVGAACGEDRDVAWAAIVALEQTAHIV